MEIAVQRRRNHEEQIGGFPVGSAVVHPAGDGDGGQAGSFDAVRLGMGHGNALTDGRGTLRLTREDGLGVGRRVRQVARSLVERDQGADGLFLGRGRHAQHDRFGFEQIDNFHGKTSYG